MMKGGCISCRGAGPTTARQSPRPGWVREPGRGRLCHLAPGHTREALLHPMYQRLLRNAVRWCLRIEDSESAPRDGAQRAGGRAGPPAAG